MNEKEHEHTKDRIVLLLSLGAFYLPGCHLPHLEISPIHHLVITNN
jgi:hypothetical protein